MCVVSGGHSDYGLRDDALVVNLSSMKKIQIDTKKQVKSFSNIFSFDQDCEKHHKKTGLFFLTGFSQGDESKENKFLFSV